MGYTVTRTLQRSYEDTVKAVREALAEQGFGVLTEIDLAGTLKQKLDVDIPPQVILGACRPRGGAPPGRRRGQAAAARRAGQPLLTMSHEQAGSADMLDRDRAGRKVSRPRGV